MTFAPPAPTTTESLTVAERKAVVKVLRSAISDLDDRLWRMPTHDQANTDRALLVNALDKILTWR